MRMIERMLVAFTGDKGEHTSLTVFVTLTL